MTFPAEAERGFTLIEVLVVLVLLSLCLGLVVARGPGNSTRLQLDATAASTVQLLRAARSRAMAAGRPVQVLFSPVRRVIQTEPGTTRVLPAGMAMTAGPAPAIGFAADGSSTGGTVQLSLGRLTRQITVDWLTGRVSVAAAP